jgi:hypothetical protein
MSFVKSLLQTLLNCLFLLNGWSCQAWAIWLLHWQLSISSLASDCSSCLGVAHSGFPRWGRDRILTGMATVVPKSRGALNTYCHSTRFMRAVASNSALPFFRHCGHCQSSSNFSRDSRMSSQHPWLVWMSRGCWGRLWSSCWYLEEL